MKTKLLLLLLAVAAADHATGAAVFTLPYLLPVLLAARAGRTAVRMVARFLRLAPRRFQGAPA